MSKQKPPTNRSPDHGELHDATQDQARDQARSEDLHTPEGRSKDDRGAAKGPGEAADKHPALQDHHLAAAGVDNEARGAAQSLGLSFGDVLSLIVKYGPTVLAVLKDMLAQKEGRPIRPA